MTPEKLLNRCQIADSPPLRNMLNDTYCELS
nr:MAG TPA: hypothetical protein [Caudoviricetes sp.]